MDMVLVWKNCVERVWQTLCTDRITLRIVHGSGLCGVWGVGGRN